MARQFRSALLAFALLAAPAFGAGTPAPTRWETEAARRQALLRGVAWFDHEPIEFLRLRGDDVNASVVARYELMHDPANIARLAAAGVPDAGNLHFYKGLGLVAEGPEIERTKAAAAVAHRLGMKVSVYVGGTMFFATFDRETPAGRQWEQRDTFGRPVPYTRTQTFRHYPSVNEPAYRDYLKRVVRIAVEEVHADQIFFDNTMLQPEPESDHGPQALAAFHAFLRRRYPTAAACAARFGVSDPDLLRAPKTNGNLTRIDDPVLQEWVRFRCESLAAYCSDLYDYVKSLNPRVSVCFNLKGLYSFNRIWSNAVYHPLFAGHCDGVTFDTGGYNPRIDEDTGALVSEIRSYRLGRLLGFSFLDDKLGDDLSVACYMAFNYQKPIPGGAPVGGPDMTYATHVITPLFEFFRHYNRRYFTDTTAVSDVGVFATWPSLAYSVSANYVPLTLAEQVLIQHHIPFDPLRDEEIGRLHLYPAIILAGQDAMSDAVIGALLDYARGGGIVLATPGTAAYDEFRHRRAKLPFERSRPEGRGRIIALPAIIPGRPLGPARGDGETNPEMTRGARRDAMRFGPPEWVLPGNHALLASIVEQALGPRLSLRTGAPLTTVAEVLRREETHESLLHFVNFDTNAPAGPFPVDLRIGPGATVRSVRLISPEANEPAPLPFTVSEGRVHFSMPRIKVYGLAVVDEASANPMRPRPASD